MYRELLRRHDYALLLGADAPQLEPSVLREAAGWLACHSERRFVLGPAEDGGFWLFGGNGPLPVGTWTSVPYSHPRTGELLHARLIDAGRVRADFPLLRDVDHAEDLAALSRSLLALEAPVGEQAELIELANRLTNQRIPI